MKRRIYRRSILDRHIQVKDILKYAGYGLLGAIAIVLLVLIPYMLGKASVTCECETEENTIKSLNSIIERSASENKTSEQEIKKNSETLKELEEETTNVNPEIDEKEAPEIPTEPVLYDENDVYQRTDERVATNYYDVDIDLIEFKSDMRGEDWGTINQLKLIITNNQDRLILPYTLKVKIYNVGDHASEWWDDEVNLRDHINIVVPGGYKILNLETHISFSDVNTKKRIVIYLYDEVGKKMTSRLKEIKINPEE